MVLFEFDILHFVYVSVFGKPGIGNIGFYDGSKGFSKAFDEYDTAAVLSYTNIMGYG